MTMVVRLEAGVIIPYSYYADATNDAMINEVMLRDLYATRQGVADYIMKRIDGFIGLGLGEDPYAVY